MNLPNKLTLLRVFLIPFFLVCMYVKFPFHYLAALAIFSAASITDALDGKIARSRNLVTNFGKFLDPLADKVLVLAALAVFVEIPDIRIGAVPLIIISAREFMVSGLRLLAANSGVVVAAGMWGKLKTAFTMIAIITALVWLSACHDFNFEFPQVLSDIFDIWLIPALIWISTVLTIISGAIYLKGYWNLIDTDK
ncbi:MAG: CDP-diacylglycerol--glycerol-3-phosphate 3-phosphatidyltransferase [Ruminococcus sp.]|nr:CDP-diacylglycerol--glycerol-3-phosphate 3-phosphatidyltransferase [Ruminococcus sp.]